MAISDLVYPSDLVSERCSCGSTNTSTNTNSCDCNKGAVAYFVPPPYVDVTKFPLYPPYPYCPPRPEDDATTIKQNNIEKKICKKSKEAAALRQLIENLETKNKNLIVKAGSVSYNLGAYKSTDPDDPELEVIDDNIESVIDILKAKLESVKDEIKELSEQLGE